MSIVNTPKPFSPGNWASNDPVGKDIVIRWLKANGIDAMENPDDYGIDLMAPRYEVERRTILKDQWFWPTVHVPYRKKKFFTFHIWYVVNVHHITDTSEFDTLMFCDSDTIKQSDVIEVPNKSMSKGEHFYDVPTVKWKIYNV